MAVKKHSSFGYLSIASKLLLLVSVMIIYNCILGNISQPWAAVILPLLVYYFLFLNFIREGVLKAGLSGRASSSTHNCSVVIPFRNEAAHISRAIHSLQNIGLAKERYEVIFVDDHSTDASAELVKNSGFQLLALPKEQAGKKAALTLGISKAKHEIVVCSDADCTYQPEWLEVMLGCFDSNTGFVSGPVEYDISSGKLLSRMLRLEFAGLVLTGAGLIGQGEPTIASGANVAYRKDLFFQVGGFSGSVSPSGDDELVMQKIFSLTDYQVRFCTDERAMVYTVPPLSVGNLLNQRSRWASKSLLYNSSLLWYVLIPSFLFFIADIALWVAVILFPSFELLAFRVITTVVKAGSEYMVLYTGRSVFSRKIELLLHVLTSVLHSFYIVFSSIKGQIASYNWKGRIN
ncbi:MAG: glycosyltransferase [Ignavibacteriales bacterium]|nr:glycosyltransferase [Ignavibacteriales bacterium]